MRVLVTRPEREGTALAARLTALGYRVALAPVTAIVPLTPDLPAGAHDAVLATSAQAFAAMDRAGRDGLVDRPVYAVGRTTAAAARQAGFADVRVAEGGAGALRDLLRLTRPAPARLLYLAGRVRKPTLETELVAEGYRIAVVETYAAVPAAWSEALCDDLRADPPGAALHFSRQSAERAIAACTAHDLTAVLAAACHLCLSADVADAFAGGRFHTAVAARPNLHSLLQALDASVAR